MPRFKRGIQYAEASRFDPIVSGILDHPLSRVMTVECVVASEAYPPTSFNHSSSVNTVTPCFCASASFEPAPGPATT